MKKIIYITILTIVPLILLFLYDYEKMENRAEEQKKSNLIKLNEQYKECTESGRSECSLLKDKINLEKEKKPLMSSLFLSLVSESIGMFINDFGLYNIFISILILIIIASIN